MVTMIEFPSIDGIRSESLVIKLNGLKYGLKEIAPVAQLVDQESEVDYVYWCVEHKKEETASQSSLKSALNTAIFDFENWGDKPLEIRVNDVVKYTWRKLWQQLTPLPEIGPNDQVVFLISPLDKL